MTGAVLVLQHTPWETLGLLEAVLRASGLRAEWVRPWDGQAVPGLAGRAGLIALGGPMGVYDQDRYPWLAAEGRLLEAALKEGAPVLGICLGSQLLAAALGAPVRRGPRREIGWHEVRLSEAAAADPLWAAAPAGFVGFHWHGDVFDLPSGARSLASSALTSCQAFVHGGGAYGVLFHMEVTQRVIADMVAAFGDELRVAGVDGDALLAEGPRRLPGLHRVGRPVFQAWADLVRQRRAD